ncbi:MAG: cyclic nucleotide-binding domain-containing protein, partial [Holophagales bacterium]|nr:cyclic nucleotide-binding domain-containing protein [Holophagales bacterium]
MSRAETELPIDPERISSLARELAENDMVDEATGLFEIALRLAPHNRGLQLSLAKLRNQMQQDRRLHRGDAEDALRKQFRRNAIDACHFFGLAALYRDRGKRQHADECLEIALGKEPIHPSAYKLRGKMLFGEKDYDGARSVLRTARRFNPFDRWTSELLGRVEYEREQYRDSLEAMIDAFLLLGDDDHRESKELKGRIRELKRLVGLSSEEMVEVFHERQVQLQTQFDRLELQRERYLQEKAEAADSRAAHDAQSGRILLAVRLRQFEIWQRLDDEHVFQLTRAAYEETLEHGEALFDLGDPGYDLYLLEEGAIRILRPTHYGDFELARIGPGTLFGEVNFISRIERSGAAVAEGPVRLVRLAADELDDLILERPDLGVRIFLSFWQCLALELRGANEQLRTFFTEEADPERLGKLREAGEGARVAGGSDATLAVLRESGLSGAELQTLANFSNTKRYPGGTYLFHEGDEGKEMYVVLEGKVMISKFIPGGGEEALAILQRGDFFGEM